MQEQVAASVVSLALLKSMKPLEADDVLNSGLGEKGSPRQRSLADPCSLEHAAAGKDEAGRGSGGYVSSNCSTTTREVLKIKDFEKCFKNPCMVRGTRVIDI